MKSEQKLYVRNGDVRGGGGGGGEYLEGRISRGEREGRIMEDFQIYFSLTGKVKGAKLFLPRAIWIEV